MTNAREHKVHLIEVGSVRREMIECPRRVATVVACSDGCGVIAGPSWSYWPPSKSGALHEHGTGHGVIYLDFAPSTHSTLDRIQHAITSTARLQYEARSRPTSVECPVHRGGYQAETDCDICEAIAAGRREGLRIIAQLRAAISFGEL